MDRGTRCTTDHGVARASDMIEQLNLYHHYHHEVFGWPSTQTFRTLRKAMSSSVANYSLRNNFWLGLSAIA